MQNYIDLKKNNVINVGDIIIWKIHQTKALTKQMEELVNVVLPCLAKMGETNSEMPVGMLLVSLVSDKLISEEKFIEVQKNLKEMKKLGDMLGFDKKLVGILNALVP